MAELADAHGSGPCESNFMQVQVLLSAPNSKNPNPLPTGTRFGFLVIKINSKKIKKTIDKPEVICYNIFRCYARVAESADAHV